MSKNYHGEEVLVISRSLFDSLGSFQGCHTDIQNYLPCILDPKNNHFMDRAQAEEDPTFKQLIPYCIFHYEGTYLHYTRGGSGGEDRLHAAGSIGIGGHINPEDQRSLAHETYLAGVTREIEEELHLEGEYSHTPIALINDDSNAVGQVHLGIVHLVHLESANVSAAEDALANLSFQPLSALQSDPLYERLETWSQYCVNHLPNIS